MNRTGQYSAQVEITDDAGATRTDTLYVTVETPRGPTVDLSGPATTTAGQPTDLTVNATADDRDLQRLVWFRNDSRDGEFDLDGDEANRTVTRTFEETGTYEFRASVLDEGGYSRDGVLTVEVVEASTGTAGSNDQCPDGGQQVWQAEENTWICRENAVATTDDQILTVSNGAQDALTHEGAIRWSSESGETYRMDRDEAVERGVMDNWDDDSVDLDDLLEYGTRVTRSEREVGQIHSGAVGGDAEGVDGGNGVGTATSVRLLQIRTDVEDEGTSSRDRGQGEDRTDYEGNDSTTSNDNSGGSESSCPPSMCGSGGYR